MLSVLAVALAMGLSNLAAATGIGIAGVDRRLRWRVGIVFGLFEALMPSSACCSATGWPTRSARPPPWWAVPSSSGWGS